MSRTVVYPEDKPGGPAARGAEAVAQLKPDGYGDKLMKYVPAEVVAFYAVVYAFTPEEGAGLKWFVLAVGILATMGYLVIRSAGPQHLRWYTYALSGVAFLAWAFGTSSVGQDLLALSPTAEKIILPSGVLLVPLADEVLTKLKTASQTA